MSDVRDDDALRSAFRDLPAAPPGECPPAERIAASARGELGRADERALLDHLAGCGACAAAWRAVRATGAGWVPVRGRPRWAAVAAMLVVALLGAGTWYVARRPTALAPPAHRAIEPGAPVPLSPVETLSAPWELRWSAGLEGTTYDVHVTTLDLDELHTAVRVTGTSYLLPEEAVTRIRARESVVWQVVAHLPDGERHASRSVVVAVGR